MIERPINRVAVNRGERMRWRALQIEARAGRLDNADRLVALSLEAGSIR